MKKHVNIPVFIPELACPFQCIYCNQVKISGQSKIPSPPEIIQLIETYLSTIDRDATTVEVAFFGGNFTGINMQKQEELLKLVQPFIEKKQVDSVRISTRPDYIDEENLRLLKKYHVGTIELGAQSMNDEVLQLSQRGHSVKDILQASALIQQFEFYLGLQMMIGLPGDSREKCRETAQKIIELGADNTRIYPTLVIKGTLLEQWVNEGKYEALSLSEAISQTADIIPLFEKAGVNILKVGLHPTDGFTSGKELVAGPYHPSFRELVLTEIWKRKILPLMRVQEGNEIFKISVPEDQMNYAIGFRQKNKKMLKQHFKDVRFIITT